MNGDEREDRIHAESARNGFIAYTVTNLGLWSYSLIYMDQVDWSLYIVAYGPLLIFAISMIYYHWKGLKNSPTVSKLRSE